MFTFISFGSFLKPFAGICFAFTVSDGIDQVGNGMGAGTGNFGSILSGVASSFIPLIATAAVLAMTISGFFLAITGNENTQTLCKRIFIAGVSAIVLLNVIPSFAPAVTGVLTTPGTAGSAIAAEALGVLTFLEIPLGIACVVMIIYSGIRAIINFGSEDGVAQLRKTVFFVIAGFILVYTRSIIGIGVTSGAPSAILSLSLTIVNRIIGFTTILAIAMLIYAGMLMIVNLNKEDQYAKAKSLVLRVAIGLIIMFASGGIIYLLTGIVT